MNFVIPQVNSIIGPINAPYVGTLEIVMGEEGDNVSLMLPALVTLVWKRQMPVSTRSN